MCECMKIYQAIEDLRDAHIHSLHEKDAFTSEEFDALQKEMFAKLEELNARLRKLDCCCVPF